MQVNKEIKIIISEWMTGISKEFINGITGSKPALSSWAAAAPNNLTGL